MPELSNIQTAEKVDTITVLPALDRFRNVLRSIGIRNREMENAFAGFEWKIDEDGFVISDLSDFGYFASLFPQVKIRPHVMFYTAAVDSSFRDNWMECSLLIDAEELRDYSSGAFYSHIYQLIPSLCAAMQKSFRQTGVYFTDERQDGADFDGIRCEEPDKLWQFDYALIPPVLRHLYSVPPPTHSVREYTHYM